ncbi:unnamed protein product [Ixodes hexagonus]
MPNNSPDPLYTLRGHSGAVNTAAFVDTTLFTGSSDGEIFGWNLETFRRKHTLEAHQGKSILWIGHAHETLITQGRDGAVCMWNKERDQWKISATLATDAKGFCQCSHSSTLIAAPSEQDWKISLWDLRRQVVTMSTPEPPESPGMAMCTRLCVDGSVILVGYENGSLATFDTRCGKQVATMTPFTEPVMCVDFDDVHHKKGICGSVTNELCVFENLQELSQRRRVAVVNDGFCSVNVRPDGKIVASGGWDGRVRVFGWKSLKPLAVLDFHKESVQAVRFSEANLCQKGVLLASCSKDRTVGLWSLYS